MINSEKEKKRRSDHCNNGAQHLVCEDCSKKYSERDSYDGTITVRESVCYICGESKWVGPSRKYFGFHRFI